MNTNISRLAEKVENSRIRKMFNLAAGMNDVINLGIGEPDFATPPNIILAAEEAMRTGQTHYTSNVGNRDLREAIAVKVSGENDIPADPDKHIIITTGAMGGLFLAFQVILDPGDEVIIPVPSWSNYINQVMMAGGIPRLLETDISSGFDLDPDKLERIITPRTKAVLLNTPTNPTGAVMSRGVLEAVANIAVKHNLIIVSDEVYEYFIWDNAEHVSIGSLPGMSERTVTINSLSKTYSMTGWRIGYTVAPEAVISAMVKLQENVYACVSSIAQVAGVEALTGTRRYLHEMIDEYRRRRDFLMRSLGTIPGLSVVPSGGTFYLVADIDSLETGSDEFTLRLLQDAGVCLIPGTAFGRCGREYVRISYANSMDALKQAVERISVFIRKM